MPDVDHGGDDLGYYGKNASAACNSNPKCAAFNEYGLIKSSSTPLTSSVGSCLYVKISSRCPQLEGYTLDRDIDYPGNDITCSPMSLNEAHGLCSNDANCRGFNSLVQTSTGIVFGCLKRAVGVQNSSPGFCFYTKRGCPSGHAYDERSGTCTPCERGSVSGIGGAATSCTPCGLGFWPDATRAVCALAGGVTNSELVAFDVSANPGPYFEFATDDSGSGSRDNLRAYRPRQGYWFGHTGLSVSNYDNIPLPTGTRAFIIAADLASSNPPLKPPSRWYRKWGFSGGYGIWCPTPPSGYVALGCVFRRSDTVGPQPAEVERLMTLRADLAVAAGGVAKIWFDGGTGASLDGTLWRPSDSSAGFASGAMVGSTKYDASSALVEISSSNMNWVLSSTRVFRTTAPFDGCPAGTAFNTASRTCIACPAGHVSPGYLGPCNACASGTAPNADRSACEASDTFAIELLAFDVSANPGSYFTEVTNDRGSGADGDVRFFRPNQGLWFGYTAINIRNNDDRGKTLPSGIPAFLYAVRNLDRSNSPVKAPVGWKRVWGTRKCGPFGSIGIDGVLEDTRLGLWCPVPPPGYVALGCVFRNTGCGCKTNAPGDTTAPPPDSVDGLVTVRQDLAIPARAIELIWTDEGSGASLDASVWRVVAGSGASLADGAMVGSSLYDANAALQQLQREGLIWTLNRNKVAVLQGAPEAIPSPTGSVSCGSLDKAVSQFAPIIKHDSSEQHFPSSMDYYLTNSAIGSSKDGTIPGLGSVVTSACSRYIFGMFSLSDTCTNGTVLPASADCAACMKTKFGVDVNAPTTSTLRDFDTTACPTCPAPSNTFLNPRPGAGTSYAAGTRPRPAFGFNPPVYAVVVERERGGIVDIFYQTFYPYNAGKAIPPINTAVATACDTAISCPFSFFDQIGLEAVTDAICKSVGNDIRDATSCVPQSVLASRYGDHFGDFEAVVVRLVFHQGVPFIWQLGGSRHGSFYPYRPVGRITYAQGGHPVLYALSGGHGLQSHPGQSLSDEKTLAQLGVQEYFDGKGAEWQTYKNIETVYTTRHECPAKGEMHKWWNNYSGGGRFGRSKYGMCLGGEATMNAGPTAPKTKGSPDTYKASGYNFPTNF